MVIPRVDLEQHRLRAVCVDRDHLDADADLERPDRQADEVDVDRHHGLGRREKRTRFRRNRDAKESHGNPSNRSTLRLFGNQLELEALLQSLGTPSGSVVQLGDEIRVGRNLRMEPLRPPQSITATEQNSIHPTRSNARIRRHQESDPGITCIQIPTGAGVVEDQGCHPDRLGGGRHVPDRLDPVRGFVLQGEHHAMLVELASMPGRARLLRNLARVGHPEREHVLGCLVGAGIGIDSDGRSLADRRSSRDPARQRASFERGEPTITDESMVRWKPGWHTPTLDDVTDERRPVRDGGMVLQREGRRAAGPMAVQATTLHDLRDVPVPGGRFRRRLPIRRPRLIAGWRRRDRGDAAEERCDQGSHRSILQPIAG